MIIAFIGLGNMGTPIARNLLNSGFELRVFNRTKEKAASLVEQGARLYDSPAAVAQDADVVITMLSDDAAVTVVSNEITPVMKSGAIHFSMSTISPAVVQQLLPSYRSRGLYYLASPVMGRPPAAEAKQLFLLLSGDHAAKEKTKAIQEAISQRSFDFGTDPSIAHTVKLTVNFTILTIVELLSEVMLMAEKTGISKEVLLETMNNTIFGAPVFKNYGSLVLQEKENPNGFTTQLAYKDLQLAIDTAEKASLQLPLGDLVKKHLEEVIENGGGKQDLPLLISHLRNTLNIPQGK